MREADDDGGSESTNATSYEVGYRRPPLHTRFQPGVSGNPSGRAKGSKNFKTLLDTILNEQIALQEGSQSKKITKAEAIMRRLVIGALKGDSKSFGALFRLAEQTGQFEEAPVHYGIIERVIVDPRPHHANELPASSDTSRDEP